MTTRRLLFGALLTAATLFLISNHSPASEARPEHNAQSPRPTNKPDLSNDIQQIRKLNEERKKLLLDLKALGMPDGKERLDWSLSIDRSVSDKYFSLIEMSPKVFDAMTKLWADSGYPGFIPSIKSNDLLENLQGVLKSFDHVEKDAADPDKVLTWIAKDVAALDTEYCLVALDALQTIVSFDIPASRSHPGTFFPITDNDRRRIFKAFQTWYRDQKSELTWDPDKKQFNAKDGFPFRRPHWTD